MQNPLICTNGRQYSKRTGREATALETQKSNVSRETLPTFAISSARAAIAEMPVNSRFSMILLIKLISNKVQAVATDNTNIFAVQVNKVSNETLKNYFGKTLAVFSESQKKGENNDIYMAVPCVLNKNGR